MKTKIKTQCKVKKNHERDDFTFMTCSFTRFPLKSTILKCKQ